MSRAVRVSGLFGSERSYDCFEIDTWEKKGEVKQNPYRANTYPSVCSHLHMLVAGCRDVVDEGWRWLGGSWDEAGQGLAFVYAWNFKSGRPHS